MLDAVGHALDARIDLSGGELRPGATNEAGASDEIELTFYLRDGQNIFSVNGLRARADDVRVGEFQGDTRFERRLNLNAAEETGIDVDARVYGALIGMTLYGRGGADHFNGNGGPDVGAPYAGRLTLFGHSDPDLLEGGRVGNEIHGGRAGDRIVGWKGGDALFGENGNDLIYGRRGWDELFGGDGGDLLAGGHGTQDACTGGEGKDTIVTCEKVAP